MTNIDTYTIRQLTLRDFDAWLPLWGAYLASNSTRMRWVDRTALFRLLASKGGEAASIVVEVEGELVGFAHFQIHRSEFAFENAFYIQDVFILPEHRGKDTGAALIRAVYAHAQAQGAPVVYWIAAENTYRGRGGNDPEAVKSPFLNFTKAA